MYGNPHRLFLQCILSRKILSEEHLEELKSKCFQAFSEEEEEETQRFLAKLGDKLDPLGLEIKKGFSNKDGQVFYVLINIISDNFSKLSTFYSTTELSFLKGIIELIMKEKSFEISSIKAIQHGRSLYQEKKGGALGTKDCEDLLERFVDDSWLGKNSEGKIFLELRLLLELEQYLLEKYPDDLILCCYCRKIATVYEKCHGANCPTYFHVYCVKNILVKKESVAKCPVCTFTWNISNGTNVRSVRKR
jgi:hypothetical protein